MINGLIFPPQARDNQIISPIPNKAISGFEAINKTIAIAGINFDDSLPALDDVGYYIQKLYGVVYSAGLTDKNFFELFCTSFDDNGYEIVAHQNNTVYADVTPTYYNFIDRENFYVKSALSQWDVASGGTLTIIGYKLFLKNL